MSFLIDGKVYKCKVFTVCLLPEDKRMFLWMLGHLVPPSVIQPAHFIKMTQHSKYSHLVDILGMILELESFDICP